MNESTGRSSPSSSRIGGLEQLGRYELICVMSRAEYGSTWACIATAAPDMGRVFCLRRIVVSPGDEDQVSDPLLKVANAWEGVSRPGMVPVVDAVAMAGRLGIVSQYVEGEPLRSVLNLAKLRKLPVPQSVALRVATDLVQALVNLIGAALKKPELSKTTHGGVLPDVVLLASTGETRITESGVTAEITRLPVLMRHEKLLAYQAPEQLSGGRIDARTDVFCVGVLLWEMLAGRSLFLPDDLKPGDDRASELTRKRVLELAAARLDDPKLGLESPVDKAIADVVERAVQKSATSRFGSLQEMATALRKAVAAKAGSRKDVASYVTELIGSTLETRQAAIQRASLGAPGDPVPADEAQVVPSQRSVEIVPVPAEFDVDVDMDTDLGDGDDLEELQPEATGERTRPPVPPRVEIKSAPKPKWPAGPSLLGDKSGRGPLPRPGMSPKPPAVAKPPSLFELPKDEPASKDKKPEAAAEIATEAAPNPFEQPFAPTPAPSAVVSPEPSPEPSPESASGRATPIPSGDEPESARASAPVMVAPAVAPAVVPVVPVAPVAPAVAPAATAQPAELDVGTEPADRKRKLMYIVGGVVAVAALVVIIAGLASMGSSDEETPTPTPSATEPPVATTPPAPEVKPVQDAGAPSDAQPDAEAGQDAAKDVAVDVAPEAAAKGTKPRSTGPTKPRPKPYMPAEI